MPNNRKRKRGMAKVRDRDEKRRREEAGEVVGEGDDAFSDSIFAETDMASVVHPANATNNSGENKTEPGDGQDPAKAKKKKKKKKTKSNAALLNVKKRSSEFADLCTEALTALAGRSKRQGTLSDWLNPQHNYHWKQLKQSWAKIPKRDKAALIERNTRNCENNLTEITHRFVAESDDHCETPPEAYADISLVLENLAQTLGKSKATLKIYDPFYCSGAMVKHLEKLGFSNVYNMNEDFYKVQAKDAVPEHDVLVTNPPYSADHVERLLEFVEKNGKPTLLLMPNYVCTKTCFPKDKYTFICPRRRYNYWTPKGLRSKTKLQNHASTLGIRTSPFISFWYLTGVDKTILETYVDDDRTFIIAKPADLPSYVAPKDKE